MSFIAQTVAHTPAHEFVNVSMPAADISRFFGFRVPRVQRLSSDGFSPTTQRNPTCVVEVSMASACRAAGQSQRQ